MTTLFSYTADFREEFEAETGSLMRQRFRWFAWCNLALYWLAHYLSAAIGLIEMLVQRDASRPLGERVRDLVRAEFSGVNGAASVSLLTLAFTAVCIGAMAHSRRTKMSIRSLVLFTQWYFFSCGLIEIASEAFTGRVGYPWELMISHLLACALVPWTAKQALRPMMPLLGLNVAAIFAFGDWSLTEGIWISAGSIATIVPGVVVCKLRHSRRLDRFQLNFLRTRYGQLNRELGDARRIHESLFPKPQLRGVVRFDYRYLPMRLIGGDYLYFKQQNIKPSGVPITNAILLDVTGHGIAAALTVNRLYGEIERFFAEHPGARPGDVLSNLNRYVHLTLASHSVYATALCIRIDPALSELEYASAGHPPSFIRAVDGTIDELPSTAFVLGAVPPDDFEAAPSTRRYGPGDTLIAYTDGAIEARNDQGRMLGVSGLQRFIAASPTVVTGGWAPAILGAVDSHRAGAPHDDTLIVEIFRTVGMDTDSGKTSAARMRTREYIVVR